MATYLSPEICRRAKLLSDVHSQRTVAEILGISKNSLWHLKRRGWRPITTATQQRERPADFAIQCRHMSREELAAHYRTSNTILARWGRELRG